MNTPNKKATYLATLTGLLGSISAHAAVITTGLIGEYDFENSNADDATGIIGNGIAVGAPTYTTAGIRGTVLNLSPTNYINIANDPDVPAGAESRTVALWVKIDTYGADSGPFRSGTTADGEDFSLEMAGVSGTLTANGWNADTNFTAPTGTGEWHHVAITYDGTTVRTYFDGVATEFANQALNTAESGIRFGGPRIGRTTNDGATQSIDDVLIYNRALTSTEITTIFDAGSIPEPSSALLAMVGLLGLTRRRR